MANNTKATAKRSRTTKTTVTAGAVKVTTKITKDKVIVSRKGRPTPVTEVTTATVKTRYAEVIAYNKARGVKPPYQPTGAFLSAILRAFAVASLTEAGISTAKGEAGARRDHARKVKAGKVTADMVVHANHKTATEGVGVFTDRPENTVRERLVGFCKVMGYAPDTLYAVRGDKYEAGEAGSAVYILRK